LQIEVTCDEDSDVTNQTILLRRTSHARFQSTRAATSVERCVYVHRELQLCITTATRQPAYTAVVMHGIRILAPYCWVEWRFYVPLDTKMRHFRDVFLSQLLSLQLHEATKTTSTKSGTCTPEPDSDEVSC